MSGDATRFDLQPDEPLVRYAKVEPGRLGDDRGVRPHTATTSCTPIEAYSSSATAVTITSPLSRSRRRFRPASMIAARLAFMSRRHDRRAGCPRCAASMARPSRRADHVHVRVEHERCCRAAAAGDRDHVGAARGESCDSTVETRSLSQAPTNRPISASPAPPGRDPVWSSRWRPAPAVSAANVLLVNCPFSHRCPPSDDVAKERHPSLDDTHHVAHGTRAVVRPRRNDPQQHALSRDGYAAE